MSTWHVMRALFDRRTPIIPKLIGIILLAYIIIPFDFLPDAPVVGWLDDASLTVLGLFLVSKLVPVGILEEYKNK